MFANSIHVCPRSRQVPDAEVFVYANYLPGDMFSNYTDLGYLVHLVRYDERDLFEGTPLWKWAADLDEWKAGPYFYSHYTDAFRLCVLWKYGGIYIDFDVIIMKVCTCTGYYNHPFLLCGRI